MNARCSPRPPRDKVAHGRKRPRPQIFATVRVPRPRLFAFAGRPRSQLAASAGCPPLQVGKGAHGHSLITRPVAVTPAQGRMQSSNGGGEWGSASGDAQRRVATRVATPETEWRFDVQCSSVMTSGSDKRQELTRWHLPQRASWRLKPILSAPEAPMCWLNAPAQGTLDVPV